MAELNRERPTTGNPGSVIVPHYGSSKITVFVWGKNAIPKFLENTKQRSMKLTLQLVVVVVNASTKFRDNLFQFTPYTIIIYKVGDTTCHLAGPDQRAAKKMRPGHCTKKNPSRES